MSYRIRTIAERSGVPAMTLRSWERRYGFPAPERSTSGYRAYSDEDLRQVIAVKQMVDDGVAVSEAVERVRELQPASQPQVLLEAVLHAAAAMAERDIERIVSEAEQALDERTFCYRFALPALKRAGDDLDIAGEHLMSAIIRAHLRGVIENIAKPAGGRPVLLACPANEEHEGGLLAVALELRLRGIRTIVLGANTPSEAIAAAARKSKARAVGLSLVAARSDANLSQVLRQVVAAVLGLPVIVGGALARKRLKLVFESGAAFAEDADELLAVLSAA